MDFAALQAAVLGRLSMGSDDPDAAKVPGYINEALHELETAGGPSGWPWLREQTTVTVAAAATYAFSTLVTDGDTTLKILDMQVLYQTSYYQPMTFMSPVEAENYYRYVTTATPEAWYAEGGLVFVFPTPAGDTTFKLRTLKMEPDLSEGTDTPVMPSVFHSAIVEAALALHYEALQDTAKMQATQARVDRWIKRMEVYGPQTATSPRVAVRDPLLGV